MSTTSEQVVMQKKKKRSEFAVSLALQLFGNAVQKLVAEEQRPRNVKASFVRSAHKLVTHLALTIEVSHTILPERKHSKFEKKNKKTQCKREEEQNKIVRTAMRCMEMRESVVSAFNETSQVLDVTSQRIAPQECHHCFTMRPPEHIMYKHSTKQHRKLHFLCVIHCSLL